MHPALIGHYHLKIFMTVAKDIQLERIRRRSGEELLERFITEWIPRKMNISATSGCGSRRIW